MSVAAQHEAKTQDDRRCHGDNDDSPKDRTNKVTHHGRSSIVSGDATSRSLLRALPIFCLLTGHMISASSLCGTSSAFSSTALTSPAPHTTSGVAIEGPILIRSFATN
jgi:hypothetical protein